ncbi:MAG TPA: fluoride efflux transporter CrcB [Planctomycetota bacterium]|nr:fluoride efflux transporter CrcB [Planctomycetota bacterium]
MTRLLLVVAGGSLGALARYGLSGLAHRLYGGTLPVGTLAVNVLGCLLAGSAMSLIEDRQALSSEARTFLLIGVLGAFTTFSSFGYETLALLRSGENGRALLNVAANVVLGLGAVWIGWGATRALFQ